MTWLESDIRPRCSAMPCSTLSPDRCSRTSPSRTAVSWPHLSNTAIGTPARTPDQEPMPLSTSLAVTTCPCLSRSADSLNEDSLHVPGGHHPDVPLCMSVSSISSKTALEHLAVGYPSISCRLSDTPEHLAQSARTLSPECYPPVKTSHKNQSYTSRIRSAPRNRELDRQLEGPSKWGQSMTGGHTRAGRAVSEHHAPPCTEPMAVTQHPKPRLRSPGTCAGTWQISGLGTIEVAR